MPKHALRRRLGESDLIRVIIVASILIIGSIILFQTDLSSRQANKIICDNCNHESFQQSYFDKLLDPISIFTFFLVVSTVLLWQATERLASLAESQGVDTREAALAAKKSAEIAERALTVTERAFVFMDSGRPIPPPEGTRVPENYLFQFEWLNSGKTWTVEGKTHIAWKAMQSVITETFEFPDEGDPPGPIFLGPGARLNGGPIVVPQNFVVDAVEGRLHLYFYGWIEYDDVFASTKRHRTEFCVKVEPVQIFPGADESERQATVTLTNQALHHGADEDCFKPIQTGSRKNPLKLAI